MNPISDPRIFTQNIPTESSVQEKLQQAYNKLWGGCLCGHAEWCSFCDGSMDVPRKALREAAEAFGFTLTIPRR